MDRPASVRLRTLAFRRDPLGTLRALAKQHPRAVELRLGRRRVLFVHHPDLIGKVLTARHRSLVKENVIWSSWSARPRTPVGVQKLSRLHTTDHEANLAFRRLLQRAFTAARLRGYEKAIADEVANRLDRWQDGATVDAADEMRAIAIAAMGTAVFSFPLQQNEELPRAIETLGAGFASPVSSPLLMLASARHASGASAFDALLQLMTSVLAAAEPGSDDVPSLLAEAGEEAALEALLVLLAGVDTTTTSLTWLLAALAAHPEAQGEGAVDETLRMYPPSWYIGRLAMEDFTVGGVEVQRGGMILLSPFVTHRDARWYDEPDEFRPQRWSGEPPPRHAFFPFGGGERRCLGERLARMELAAVDAYVSERLDLELSGPLPRPLPGATLVPDRRVLLRVHRRA